MFLPSAFIPSPCVVFCAVAGESLIRGYLSATGSVLAGVPGRSFPLKVIPRYYYMTISGFLYRRSRSTLLVLRCPFLHFLLENVVPCRVRLNPTRRHRAWIAVVSIIGSPAKRVQRSEFIALYYKTAGDL